ncbi:MAG TPA: hypothetical protein PKE12_06595 [Kiritimatiellia bacterium]|nr:hypothetical protein [Kiritimatiellia bacterium]
MARQRKSAVKTTPFKLVEKPHPLGEKTPYLEVQWPELPNPPTPTLPLPTPFPPIPKPSCDRPCTAIVQMLPKTLLNPGSGFGQAPVKVDGYRFANLYVISDPVNSSNDRGFTLEVSFACFPFVYGEGVRGETNHMFNFDALGYASGYEAKIMRIKTSDQGVTNQLPRYGGRDLTHILRIPILGPYMRAIASNVGQIARNVEVVAYLMT